MFIKIALLSLGLLVISPRAEEAAEQHSARTLVHLLDYLAQDYAGAVSDGRVISQTEYAEQVEFAQKAWALSNEFPAGSSVAALEPQFSHLRNKIDRKERADSVAMLALTLKQKVLTASGIPTYPMQWPDREQGRQLFSQNCVSCHGPTGKGDGAAGLYLDPRPANFHDDARMSQLSPFQIFNTIRLGVDGTGMQPFPQLTESQVWDLAFYIASLRHEADSTSAKKAWERKHVAISLQQLSANSDRSLENELGEKDSRSLIVAIRLWPDTSVQKSSDFLKLAMAQLDMAKALYREGKRRESRDAALTAYLEGVEPLEARLRALDPQFVLDLESSMMGVRSAIQSGQPVEKINLSVDSAKALLRQADDLMGKKSLPPWSIFIATVGILMREGFEALLVIVAILGVVRATGTKKAAAYVHGGWVLAVAAGFAAWFLSGWVARLSGADREMTEGVSSLFAVAVLLYMGFWMHSKSEIEKWKAFIHSKLKGTLTERGLLALGGFSFLVVFREAFETVLFLSALNLEGEGTGTIILTGTLFSLSLTLALGWLFLNTSRKLPTRIFFSISSFIMAVLAVILAGKGTHALQEAGIFTITTSPVYLRIDLLGWYPTIETWAAQLAVLLLAAFLLRPRRRNKKAGA